MKTFFAAAILSLLLHACTGGTNQGNNTGTDTAGNRRSMNDTSGNGPDTSMIADSVFAIIIDTSDKQLRVIKGADTVKNYPISVGTAKYPTPIGSFRIHQIDFNPDWTPPEGDWAKNRNRKSPAAKKIQWGRRVSYIKCLIQSMALRT